MARAAPTSRGRGSGALLVALAAACSFDPSYRDVPKGRVQVCAPGETLCRGSSLSRCQDDGFAFQVLDDCGKKGLVCAGAPLLRCTPCSPGAGSCMGQTTETCRADGSGTDPGETCDPGTGVACRGGSCRNLCVDSVAESSNIGCEYWAVDLDNAVVSASGNAASQQFAVVVSNAEQDVSTSVVVDVDDAKPGDPPALRVVGTATLAPNNLEVFKLGPREVDGSPDGQFNTGTGTALTRHAFRVRASMPIVAYQFNPLENVNVFSNDASQLLPTSALGVGSGSYVVASWPQTIATSSNPAVNFGLDLRAFLAVVGTRPDTHVHVHSAARIIPGGPLGTGLDKGADTDVVLQPFEVLNLETGDFNADFTGSLVTSDRPVVVFPGSEASDAPFFGSLSERFCCADHLEEQLPPVRAVGESFALARAPNRTRAIAAAGGKVGIVDEPEYFRVVAVAKGITHIETTLPAPDNAFDLPDVGADRTLIVRTDFMLKASQPAIVLDVQASQEAAGVPRGLPGGDPSITYVAPVEQWRNDYVLLTPDKYAFDFLVISAEYGSHLFLDGLPLDGSRCEIGAGDGKTDEQRGYKKPAYQAYRCQLSYPTIDSSKPTPDVQPGKQSDGVHRLQADRPIGVVVYGFDSFVSYAYAGGTDLKELFVP